MKRNRLDLVARGCILALSSLLVLAGGAAAQKQKRPHVSRQKAKAPVVLEAITQDRAGHGHIDGIRITLSEKPSKRHLGSVFTVAGYRILSVRLHGRQVELNLLSHATYDTGARPAVSVRGLRGSSGTLAAPLVITPADRAAPVLISATTADRNGDGRLDAINFDFSEPVRVGPGGVTVQGYTVLGTRDYPSGQLVVLLQEATQPDTTTLPRVLLNGTELRDGAGNPGPSGWIAPTSGAAPVLVSAKDEGFWLDGEKVATFWSGPVRLTGGNSAGGFSMLNSVGTPIAGQDLVPGAAPNEIDVDLPFAAETPTTLTYVATEPTRVESPSDLVSPSSFSLVTVGQQQPQFAGTLTDPFNQDQLIGFGGRSFYLQPWRSYIDTFPATRILNAVGINFNANDADPYQMSAGAQLLHNAGFTHARISIPWNDMDYTNPGQLSAYLVPWFTDMLTQLRNNGIRPLILLQSNSGIPCPVASVTLNLTAPAPAGATTVQLDGASASLVQPGLTGFNQYGMDAGVLITSVASSGVATLSQPLQTALPAGSVSATTLKYQPFFPQYNSDGTPNANNEATLAGWLQYVAGVTKFVRQVLGDDDFDVEVWNELSFGSQFLYASNYYSQAPAGSGDMPTEITQATVDYIRAPASGLPDVGIGDGFSNEEPWTSGTNEVPGITAIDKHPYMDAMQFPSQTIYNGDRPVDALGQLDGTLVDGNWVDTFVPTFTSLFPEYWLTDIQTETEIRDLAPFPNDIYGGLHGRYTHPLDAPAPQMWLTELNLDAGSVNFTLTSPTGGATSSMSAADVSHFEAKAILRYLSAWVGKGVTQLDFYAAANAGDLNLIDPDFWAQADDTHSYPGLAAGGETMVAVRNFLNSFTGAENLTQTTPLNLTAIADYDGGYQFTGNGTAAYPDLYNRDVIGFFPFQVDQHKWVIPTYVMTRDLATLYNSSASSSDVTRADLPPEVFRLTITGVDPVTASAAATDPLTGQSVPVKITQRGSKFISLEIPLTDYPRMLTLTDGGG